LVRRWCPEVEGQKGKVWEKCGKSVGKEIITEMWWISGNDFSYSNIGLGSDAGLRYRDMTIHTTLKSPAAADNWQREKWV
jgi:hypothetical protein